MATKVRSDIRNVAIIAHVDHGKTTLVDALLKQSHTFRANQQMGELIMDSNPLERERGITILAKNTAIVYKGIKINIIDTPGHADFSGEVERVINMADGCLLVVDAVSGPMPQTRYVLKKALARGLKPVVFVNKTDRSAARPAEVVSMVQDLFLELATESEQLEFPVLYGSGRAGFAMLNPGDEPKDMEPLFEAMINQIPPPTGDDEGPFQMLVAALAYDNHLGQLCIGRITRGKVAPGNPVVRIDRQGKITASRVERLFIFQGLERREVNEASAGEIITMAGVEGLSIGETITSPDQPEALPTITIEEPTVKMTIGVNTSPFAGKEGQFSTSRQLRSRLFKELQTNVSLRVEETDSPDVFLVAGRGELHLSIFIEIMRREGYEFQVSRPEAVTKEVNGRTHEPYEQLRIDTREEYIGALTEYLATRLARMTDMRVEDGSVRMEYKIPTRGLIGFRSYFVRITHGNGVIDSQFLAYEPMQGEVRMDRGGALVAWEQGASVTYGLNNAQERGQTFIEAGTPVYEGMIIGMTQRDEDIPINVCKEKKLTNTRSATSDIALRLSPPVVFSLEESLDFINPDELVEVTPRNIRLRKRVLDTELRRRSERERSRSLQ